MPLTNLALSQRVLKFVSFSKKKKKSSQPLGGVELVMVFSGVGLIAVTVVAH